MRSGKCQASGSEELDYPALSHLASYSSLHMQELSLGRQASCFYVIRHHSGKESGDCMYFRVREICVDYWHQPWVTDLTSLNLSLFICEME